MPALQIQVVQQTSDQTTRVYVRLSVKACEVVERVDLAVFNEMGIISGSEVSMYVEA